MAGIRLSYISVLGSTCWEIISGKSLGPWASHGPAVGQRGPARGGPAMGPRAQPAPARCAFRRASRHCLANSVVVLCCAAGSLRACVPRLARVAQNCFKLMFSTQLLSFVRLLQALPCNLCFFVLFMTGCAACAPDSWQAMAAPSPDEQALSGGGGEDAAAVATPGARAVVRSYWRAPWCPPESVVRVRRWRALASPRLRLNTIYGFISGSPAYPVCTRKVLNILIGATRGNRQLTAAVCADAWQARILYYVFFFPSTAYILIYLQKEIPNVCWKITNNGGHPFISMHFFKLNFLRSIMRH